MEAKRSIIHQENGLNIAITRVFDTVHYAKAVCDGVFFCWVKSPQNHEGRHNHEPEQVMRYHGFHGEPFCFICGRSQDKLGIKETITVDHIIEIRDGGADEINNTQLLCTACHKLKNWVILYCVKHQDAAQDGVADE